MCTPLRGPELSKAEFQLFTPSQIRELSVVEIKTSICFNAMDHPLKDGPYDLLMGPSGNMTDICGTCNQGTRNCPGHFGHIELPGVVVNPLFHKALYSLLRMCCTHCFRVLLSAQVKLRLIYQLKLLDLGMVTQAKEVHEVMMSCSDENVQPEVMEILMSDQLKVYMASVTGNQTENTGTTKSSKMVEALRNEFVNDALKQFVPPKKGCPFCKAPHKTIVSFKNKLLTSVSKVEVAEKFKEIPDNLRSRSETKLMLPDESRRILRNVWSHDEELMLALFPVLKSTTLEYPSDLFFLEAVLVPPPKTRPVNYVKGKILENAQTRSYRSILNNCIVIRNIIKAIRDESLDDLTAEWKTVVQAVRGDTPVEKLHQSWQELQSNVDHLLDSEMNQLTTNTGIVGLKQVVEKKQGIFRMHMMGKRVNFAARTVITPDPNIAIEEIGIPEYFAKRLSYPVPVCYFNVEQLRRMVRNGPDVYPGATIVENEDGTQVKLFGGKEHKTRREGIAKKLLLKTGDRMNGKIVHRHLLDGDMLLVNRQPTLHRPSIMAHKARVLKGEKTLRMHYSNCKAYNADFDGDEMNVHCPQSEFARSEAAGLVNVSNHYLVPKDGTPLGGLIQDHVVSGVRLTMRGQFFDVEDYHQLVFQALARKGDNIELLPPCMLKPRVLWSGKQVISTILINIIPRHMQRISLEASAKIGYKSWEKTPPRPWKCGVPFSKPNTMSEAEVIINKGELLCGVLDKQHYGATQFGLIHCLFELYGGQCSSKCLDSLGRVFTYHLQMRGFTIGVEDILVLKKPDKKRNRIVRAARKIGDDVACKALELEDCPDNLREKLEEAYFKEGIKFRARLDQEYKTALDGYTNNINKTCLPSGLLSKFPDNNLQLMVTSGAKGSTVNTMQISCLLGQIELEGKRPGIMISGRSLPSFVPFETAPRAGGYVDGRFMTGINPQEFFFHCMAGREGLIDTAVKTSRSGYLQRCLIKHLEGVTVAYDHTVRDHDGSVIQFAYGEDGLEVTKAKYFNQNLMDFLYSNRTIVYGSSYEQDSMYDETTKHLRKLRKWKAAFSHTKPKQPFTAFTERVMETIPDKYFKRRRKNSGRCKSYEKMLDKWKCCSQEEKEQVRYTKCPDPAAAVFRGNRDHGAVTEVVDALIEDYVEQKLTKGDYTKQAGKCLRRSVREMMAGKYVMSLCEPGEAVGLLAAQSVGEPSTQMTLNTFHFAGRGDMNVTLGIPRLREILMTASKNIKTPNMDIPLLKKVQNPEKRANHMKRTLQRVTVADVLEKITVDERLQLMPSRNFTYTVRFQFLPYKSYKREFVVKPAGILRHMEKKFLITLSGEIRKLGKMYGDIIHMSREEKNIVKSEENADSDAEKPEKKGRGVEEAHESSDEEKEDGDDDATKAKLRSKHQEDQEYDEMDSELGESEDEEQGREVRDEEEEEAGEDDHRQTAVLKNFGMVQQYRYDLEKQEWCEIVIAVPVVLSKIDFSTLLRDICLKSVLYEVQHVRRAIVYKNQTGDLLMKTEGINIVEMFKHNHLLDLNRLYTNDVHKMAETYGIEAAGRVIVRELQNVFGVYGITVDPRHLLLIADYMTQEGVFLPLNRVAILDNPSPLQQMSFESAIGFLKNAALRGKCDDLTSPSARIMIGRCCFSGTGSFELI